MTKLHRIAPKKSLSQNFLTDANIARKIVESVGAEKGNTVIEIGPGTGSLTRYLVEKEINLIAIELDERAVAALEQTFNTENYPHFRLIKGNALQTNLSSFVEGSDKLYVVGNLPYAITSDLLFHIFQYADSLQRCVLMVQKEVAKRITAQRGTKEYGILSLATQMVGKAKILFDVQPGSFFPRPSVTSSVFAIDFHPEQRSQQEVAVLTTLIRAAFNQRRKKLRNALEQYATRIFGIDLHTNTDSALQVYLEQRAEDLDLNDYATLLALLHNMQHHG